MRYLFIVCFFFQIYSTSAIGQEYKYHTVKAGETVYSIAKSYNISEEDIYKYNPDAKDGLDISAKLVIPIVTAPTNNETSNSDISFKQHTVAKKETLYSISKQYEVSIEDIKRYNKELYSRELRSGEEIRIPSGSLEKAPAPVERRTPAEINTQITKTREHVVLPKETKYGIARKYGLTVRELESLNPTVEVLQPGIMLRVGTNVLDEPVILTDNKFEFYEVKPQETLYSLSNRFEVEQDSLIALNPALQDGLKTGMVLKVPNTGDGFGNLDVSETEEFNDPDKVEAAETAFTRLDLKNVLINRDTKELVLMLPYNLHKIETDSTRNFKNAILDERVLRISLDFYSGALMAIEEAEELGISTNLKVYDTRQDPQQVNNIINSNNFDNVDAIIGPFLQNTTEAAAARLESKKIPVISPLSNRAMRPFDNLFQSRPTDEMLVNSMLQYLDKNGRDKNIVIIYDGKATQIKDKLQSIFPSAKTVATSGGNVSESRIREALSSGNNWVILESTSVGVLSSATSALNRLARNNEISLFTTDKNSNYDNDNVSNEHLARLKFHYPSVDKEYDKEISQEFIEEFQEKYGLIPNQYAVRGYDLTLDILLRLASADNLYESFEKHKGFTEYNENKFHYTKHEEGGYNNDAVYIVRINEDLTLSVVNDSQGSL